MKKINSYLTFRLKGELFAIGVEKVLEIIETSEEHAITALPKAPETIQGVVNFRGNVIPVVNTRKKFDIEEYAENEKHVVMVLNLTIGGVEQVIGAMADKVVDVIEIDKKDIQSVPEVGKGYDSDYIAGVVFRNDNFIMLLDIEAAIDSAEIVQLRKEEEADINEGDEAVVEVAE